MIAKKKNGLIYNCCRENGDNGDDIDEFSHINIWNYISMDQSNFNPSKTKTKLQKYIQNHFIKYHCDAKEFELIFCINFI